MQLLSCSILTLARSALPPVTMLPQYNQALNVMVSQGTSSGGTVAYMGTFVGGDGTAKCRAACLSSRKRCWSFVHFPLAAPAPATNGSSPLNGEFKITLHSSGKQLQADDLADKLLSTRYQTDDDYSRYIFSPVGDGTGAVRIAVKADGLLLQANDSPGAGAPVCPAHAVSALAGKKDDALHHFVLERNEGAEGTYAIKVVGSGRYWTVEDGADGFVSTSAAPSNTAGAFDITPFGGEFAGQCFSVSSPGFNPSYDASAVSGIVKWRCRNDDDCSLNGKCDASTGACACRPAWKGHRCELLNLGEPTRGAGYRGTDDGHNTSSWGGAVLKGGDGVYHMWAAEMTEHCGIGTWQQNSRVIHATSATPGGVYTRKVRRAFQNSPRQHTNSRLEVGASNASSSLLTRPSPAARAHTALDAALRQDVTWEVFAHEPEVVPGPNGEYIMFFTADPRSEHGDCNCCRPGVGPCDGSTGPGDCAHSTHGGPRAYRWEGAEASGGNKEASCVGSCMSYTSDPNGNWSAPQQLFPNYHGSDTNFAPLILPNGSLIGMWRRWGGGKGGSRQFLATASDWKNLSTYIQHDVELFPDLGAAGTEDQFVYVDDDGYFHAVFHHMYGTGTQHQWWLDPTGGHAFSRDGWDWTYTGVAWGNATARYNTPAGQGARLTFTDGTKTTFTRLERPHLVFGSNAFKGDPIFLTNAAQYGNGTNPGAASHNDDACYTLIQPVNQGTISQRS